MTRVEELKKTKAHLAEARELVEKARKAAVLSRHRHAALKRIEGQLLSVLDDMCLELQDRGIDPTEAWE